jgi:small subunit ribosomal protein S1
MVDEKKPKDASALRSVQGGEQKQTTPQAKKREATKFPRKGGEKETQAGRRRPFPQGKRIERKPPAGKEKASVPEKKLSEVKIEPGREPLREPIKEPPKESPQPVVVEKPSSTLIRDLSKAVEKEYLPAEFEQFLKMYEPTLRDIQEGEIVKGKVMGVTKEDVIVDVGFKSEGIIPIAEFPEPINIKVGDEIEVYLDAIEDQDGQLVLSKQKADFVRVWDKVKDAHDKGELIDGRILRRIKGGMVVDLMGVDAFLPGSQIALRQVPDFDALLGQLMQFKVIKLNKARRNIVVSRRSVLEEERLRQKEKLLKEIEPGQVREGIVKNITDFGVFIDLGGVDGLLHITDMSWGRISHPSELVALGDKINVKIIDFDKNTGRISLGMKQLTPYPWENIQERYPVGKKIKGKVVSLTDYGAFIELERGVEGLIHISEMSWTQHIKHPSRLMAIGDTVEAVVLSVDKENEKISLGIKQLEPDPWASIEQKYKVGTRVTGRVRNLTAFGAFIEVEEGIDGLVHISDMSWTKRIQHPSEVMKKGDKVEVAVLNVDRENRRISLGYKQIKEDPWPELSRKYAVANETTGRILRLLDRGVIVDLGNEVEGFVPTIHLGKPEISKPADAFSEGDELPLKVIEFDHPGKKIVLSVEAYYRGREKTELDDFLAKHPTKTQKVEEIVEERPHLGKGEKPSEKEVPKEAPTVTPGVKTSESRYTPEEEKKTEAGDIEVEEKVTSPPAEETSEKSEGSMSEEKSPEDAGT